MSNVDTEQYLQSPVAEDAVYRGWPVDWTIVEADSGSVAIRIRFSIVQMWDAKVKAWSQAWPVGYYTEGHFWVIKKDKSPNATQISSLVEAGLWDGDFSTVLGDPPKVLVLLDVRGETYEGKTRHRVSWVSPNADVPTIRSGFQPASLDLVTKLKTQFGGGVRAVAGGARNGAPPAPPRLAGAHGVALPVQQAPTPMPAPAVSSPQPAIPQQAPVPAAVQQPAPAQQQAAVATPAASPAAPLAPPPPLPSAAGAAAHQPQDADDSDPSSLDTGAPPF